MNDTSKVSLPRPLLLAVAAFPEVKAVLAGLGKDEVVERDRWHAYKYPGVSVLQTGVGKASAAGAVSHELTRAKLEGEPYAAVISIGVSGSYVGLAAGAVVLADSTVMVDEGLVLNDRFENIEDRGWAKTRFAIAKADWHAKLGATHEGTVVTISAISGTAELADDYCERSGGNAYAEDMETAAVALACKMLGVQFAAVRVICNECGVPDSWDIAAGFAKLTKVVRGWKLLA